MTEEKSIEQMKKENLIKRICVKCLNYKAIDSGYGHCKRYPPLLVNEGNIFKAKFVNRFPIVAWCDLGCGEFRYNKTK